LLQRDDEIYRDERMVRGSWKCGVVGAKSSKKKKKEVRVVLFLVTCGKAYCKESDIWEIN